MLAAQCNKIPTSNSSPPLSPTKTSFYAWKKPLSNPSMMYPNTDLTSSLTRINPYEHSLLNANGQLKENSSQQTHHHGLIFIIIIIIHGFQLINRHKFLIRITNKHFQHR